MVISVKCCNFHLYFMFVPVLNFYCIGLMMEIGMVLTGPK